MADEVGDQESEPFSLTTPSSRKRKRLPPPASGETTAVAVERFPGSPCQVCYNLGNDLGRSAECREPASKVAITAKRGCLGCKIVAWVLEPYMKRLRYEEGQIWILFANENASSSEKLVYFSHGPSSKKFMKFILLRRTPVEPTDSTPAGLDDPRCPWQLIQPKPILSCHTGSSAAVRKVQDWYSECVSSHKQCLSNSPPRLPTRVIQIREPNKARLYVSGTEHANYACLSHCWGGQSVFRTTTRNFERHTDDIPWKDLPKTFQDALQFTRSLGLEYLWIDSLCIIQDSIGDWRHEGSRMSRIYANASITLSASRAENPRQGCFAKLDKRYIPRTKKFTNSDNETYKLHCHETLPRLHSPLLERGWVFQEWMLSRRIVHFMEHEIWWECRNIYRCECGAFDHRPVRSTRFNDIVIGMSKSSSPTSIESAWQELLSVYMSKILTYPNDIFPAIQALAQLVPSTMGRYLAGHWESTIIRSLCWRTFASAPKRNMEWRAPSWSWAAIHGEVNWGTWVWSLSGEGSIKLCATLLSALVIPEGDDPMGQISYGHIVLRGKVLAGETQKTENSSASSLVLGEERTDEILRWEVHWDMVFHNEDRKRVLALKLSESNRVCQVHQDWLILEAVKGKRGEYVRVGLLSIFSDSLTDSESRTWEATQDKAVEMDLRII